MEDLLFKLSQQTEAAIARARIAVIEIANLHSKYAEKARIGLGGWKKLIKKRITNRKLLEKMEIEEQEKDKAVAVGAKAKADRVRTEEERRGAARDSSEKRRSDLLRLYYIPKIR